MQRAFLLIGLGGSGGRTLRLAKRALRDASALRQETGRPVSPWQLLHIDLPAAPETVDRPADGGIDLDPHEYLGLAAGLPRGTTIKEIAEALAAIPGSVDETAGWLPNLSDARLLEIGLQQPPGRADVRALVLRSLPNIHLALSTAMARLRASHDGDWSCVPILVGSLAGATGSALVRDMLETLDQFDREAMQPAITMLYTPDVFPDQGGGLRPQAHALNTIFELLNLAWTDSSAESRESADPDTRPSPRSVLRGAMLPHIETQENQSFWEAYLVGTATSRVSAARSIQDASARTARLITALMVNEQLLDTFVAGRAYSWYHVRGAVMDSPDVVTNLGNVDEFGAPALNALGYARVSVGTEAWRRYASHVLAAEAANTLRTLGHDGAELDQSNSELRILADSPSTEHSDRLGLEQGALTLIRPEEFPATLRELLVATLGGEEVTAQRRAARQIASAWEESSRLVTDAGPRRYRANDLIAHADQWLAKEGTPIAAFLAHDLKSFVSAPDGSVPGGTSQRSREERLVDCVTTAFTHAASPTQLSTRLMAQIHPTVDFDLAAIAGIAPLPLRGHPLEQRLRDALIQHPLLLDERQLEQVFARESESPDFEIVVSLQHAVDVTTLSSLMRPIAEAWHHLAHRDSSSGAHASDMLSGGRARPLDESLPIPTAHLRAMIRGWFTGVTLGLIDSRSEPWTIVLDPLGDSRCVAFPAGQLFPQSQGGIDGLSYALESISSAMLEVVATESLEAFHAHRALRDLGLSQTSSVEILAYPRLSPVFVHWIETGERPGGDVLPGAELHRALVDARDPRSRRDSLIALLESALLDVRSLRSQHVTPDGRAREFGEAAPRWLALTDHVEASLAALIRAAHSYDVAGFAL